jgi:hypothetical protein
MKIMWENKLDSSGLDCNPIAGFPRMSLFSRAVVNDAIAG